MRQFAKNLRSEWRRLALPTNEKTVVVAVSGGADSVSLVAALRELNSLGKLSLRVVVAHFNHALRGVQSDEDAQFVANLAQTFNFEFISETRNLKSNINHPKDNLEQAARRARYDFLARTAIAANSSLVLTGHTLDDQAETFLLRLIRGSGIDGLGAMKTIRRLENNSAIDNPKSDIMLVRPLIAWARRRMTENYCRECKIEYRTDAMNEDLHFARVRVRRELLPLLQTFNPKIAETLANTAVLLGDEALTLNAQVAQFNVKSEVLTIDSNLQNLDGALRRRVLRLWLAAQRGDLRKINFKHLRALESLFLRNDGGRTIELPGGAIVTRKQNRLLFRSKVEKTSRDI